MNNTTVSNDNNQNNTFTSHSFNLSKDASGFEFEKDLSSFIKKYPQLLSQSFIEESLEKSEYSNNIKTIKLISTIFKENQKSNNNNVNNINESEFEQKLIIKMKIIIINMNCYKKNMMI